MEFKYANEILTLIEPNQLSPAARLLYLFLTTISTPTEVKLSHLGDSINVKSRVTLRKVLHELEAFNMVEVVRGKNNPKLLRISLNSLYQWRSISLHQVASNFRSYRFKETTEKHANHSERTSNSIVIPSYIRDSGRRV